MENNQLLVDVRFRGSLFFVVIFVARLKHDIRVEGNHYFPINVYKNAKMLSFKFQIIYIDGLTGRSMHTFNPADMKGKFTFPR